MPSLDRPHRIPAIEAAIQAQRRRQQIEAARERQAELRKPPPDPPPEQEAPGDEYEHTEPEFDDAA